MNWLVIFIVLAIIGGIMTAIQNVYAKTKIALNKSRNPEKAAEAAEDAYYDDAMTLGGYEAQLIKIAESSQSPDIMRKLAEFYTKEKENEQKAQYWSRRAIQCGDIKTMMSFYGFSDFDVSYSNFNEILDALNRVRTLSNEKVFTVSYLKGIVYYKTGQTDIAKQMLEKCKTTLPQCQALKDSEGSLKNNCNYLIFLCLCKEKDINKAQTILVQLEENNFSTPAKDYLFMHDYYVEQRVNNTPHPMEIIFAENYAKCNDADRKKANQICGDAYYLTAKAYENGTDGFEKDEKQAVICYEQAARFEHTESLYIIGSRCWTADGHTRDYNKANDYLLKASSKGHAKAKEFLSQYGVDDILVFPIHAKAAVYKFLNNYQLTASAETIKWLHIFAGVVYSKNRIAKIFLNTYSRNIKSFDDLIANIHQLYADHVALMLQWCLSLLMRFGIDSYSSQDIIEMCGDLSLLPRVPIFEQGIERIDSRAMELNFKSAYSQTARSQWSGSGFGTTISGTIKAGINASIAAGVMNVGSSILHGIGDSIVESINNSEIKDMGKNLFEKKSTKTEFYNAVRSACIEIGDAVLQIIETQCNINLCPLEGIIRFNDEDLNTLDNKILDTKIINNTTAKKHEYAYALLVEKLRRNPLDGETLKLILACTVILDQSSDNEVMESISEYAGVFMIDLSATAADIEKRLSITK